MFAFKTSRNAPAKQDETKVIYRARPVQAIASDEARIESIMKRFSKSIAYLAK